ncbi:MAG: hypothetical protein ACK4TA_25375 [Saprospiraceae bacterium]
MKQLFLLSLLVVTGYACSNGNKQTVQTLNENWTATNQAVQRLTNALNDGYTHWQMVQDTMAMPPGSLQKLDVPTRGEVQTLLKNMYGYGRNYIDLGRDCNVFFKQWEAQKQQLDSVTTVVNYQQKSNLDVPGTIAALQAQVADANAKVTQWTSQIKSLNTKIDADYAAFQEKTAAIR